jgi:serine/threonine protein kinase
MFVREGKLAVQLNHPVVVKTYEIGRVKGTYFICMEYISGVDLSLVLRRCRGGRSRRMPIPHAVFIASRVCEGLHYAHELVDGDGRSLNLVNRDVSPSNVRIAFDGKVKVLDFGIAKAASTLSSEIGVLKGKISYMSPEQVRGLPLDRRSDVFSTAILLHEMLTGEKLFRADSEFQLMDLVRRADVKAPSVANPRVPKELDTILLRGLAKAPEQRYPTAEAMARDLREVLARYQFNPTELRELVRELCHEEWHKESSLIESYLADEPVAHDRADSADADYGEFAEGSTRPAPPQKSAAPVATKRSLPSWPHLLFGVAGVILLCAIVLLVMKR